MPTHPIEEERERITARVPANLRARLEQAAGLTGATINQFLVQAAVEKADRIIEREQVTVLSQRDAKKLLELLDRPPAMNEKLQRGLEQFRKVTRGNSDRAFEWPPRLDEV
jgi:uncharacterized protein (DUF1778 family)